MSDEELMARVIAGDMGALGELFERYKAPLFRFLYRFTSDAALAEDTLLDAFLRVHDRRRTYRHGMRFSTWLYTIAHHLAVDRLKHASRRHSELASDLPGDDATTRDFERSELSLAVRQAVQTLPPDQRAVIVLREYHGLSYREIAIVTGAREDAVRVRAHRARLALREALAPVVRDNLCEGV